MLLLPAITAHAWAECWQCNVTLTIGGKEKTEKILDIELTGAPAAIVSDGSTIWETGTLTRQGTALVYGDITPGETDERVVTTTMLRIDTSTGDFVWIDNRKHQRVYRGDCRRIP